ncbi:type II secretion system protein GspC [Thiohalorhabdus sp.]|uniref:type II secretion system protein GspC n=1 Tax=Thiohalorhabdus sp. TaxID=3094134 RepID=UPI002FC3A6DF
MPTITLAGFLERLFSGSVGLRLIRWLEAALVIVLAVAVAGLTWELAPRPTGGASVSKAPSAQGSQPTSGTGSQGADTGSPARGHLPAALKNLFGTPPVSQPGSEPATEPVRETRMELTLKGIIATRGAGTKLAIIAPANGEETIYHPGDEVNGRAKILRIEERRVVLRRNGVTEVLKLEVPEVEKGEGRRANSQRSIRQVSQNQRVVPQATLQKKLDNLPKLLRQAKAVPASRNGQKIGFRVVNIQEGSVFEDLGVKEGDVIQRVNGRDVRSPRQALKAYKELKGSRQFQLELLRDGQSRTLSYDVQ